MTETPDHADAGRPPPSGPAGPDHHALFDRVTRVLLPLWPADGALRVLVSPAWWDGEGLWLTVPVLQGVPGMSEPQEAAVILPDGPHRGVVARGVARAYGRHDPLALALHWPSVATASSALALRAAAPVRRAVTGLRPFGAMVGGTGLGRVAVLRVVVTDTDAWQADERAGVTPALPVEAPAEVRRALAGVHTVSLVRPGQADSVAVAWGPGFVLRGDTGPAGRAAVVADDGDGAGLALEGVLDARGTLRVERVSWWLDGDSGDSAVTPPGTIVLPE